MAKTKGEKRGNPILLFLFAVVIPLVIVIGITIVIMNIAGFDVGKWVKDADIPVVSAMIPSKEEKEYENELLKADETIQSQREQIDDLKKEIESLEAIIDDLEMDITRLENRTEDPEIDQESVEEEIKKTASSFRKMDPENAATIIQNLDKNTAVEILNNLSSDVRGGILAEMEAKNAADLTKEMMQK